jgi:hypothetical protein
MSLTDLQEKALAYYLADQAAQLNMVGRWWPTHDLISIIADKVEQAVRPFGTAARAASKPAAEAYVDQLIASGAYVSQAGKFGGTMHQFQPDVYKAELAKLQAENPIVREAEAAGPDYWTEAFAAATA